MAFSNPALEVANDVGATLPVVSPSTASTSTALSALNATVALALDGATGCGFFVSTTALTGTITAEYSFDGGTTYISSIPIWSASTGFWLLSVVYSAATTSGQYAITGMSGATHVRVKMTAWTSGTATVTLRTNQLANGQVQVAGMNWTTGIPTVIGTDSTGNVKISRDNSSTGTGSSVSSSTTNATLKASNTSRKGLVIYHKGGSTATASLYIKLGATATLTDFSYELVPGAHWECPANYTGQIDGLWDTTGVITGSKAYVTEIT